ncbi:MAG: hypothetical protein U0269_34425 [Polyangiales bacterium]
MTARTKPGSITVRRDDPKTIFVRMEGYIGGALVAAHRDEFLRLLAQSPTPMWIFDLMDLSGFEASAVPNGSEWWRAFKSGGGTHVFFVTQYGAARMAASAIGFSVGVKIIVCTSMSEARAELARAGGPPTRQAQT